MTFELLSSSSAILGAAVLQSLITITLIWAVVQAYLQPREVRHSNPTNSCSCQASWNGVDLRVGVRRGRFLEPCALREEEPAASTVG